MPQFKTEYRFQKRFRAFQKEAHDKTKTSAVSTCNVCDVQRQMRAAGEFFAENCSVSDAGRQFAKSAPFKVEV